MFVNHFRRGNQSAPPDVVVSPGSSSYAATVERRNKALKLARGTGRVVPIPGELTSAIIAHAGSAPRNAEDDPIHDVRVQMPYQRLQDANPGQNITRRAMTRDEYRRMPNDNNRHDYFERLRNRARNAPIHEEGEDPEAIHTEEPVDGAVGGMVDVNDEEALVGGRGRRRRLREDDQSGEPNAPVEDPFVHFLVSAVIPNLQCQH